MDQEQGWVCWDIWTCGTRQHRKEAAITARVTQQAAGHALKGMEETGRRLAAIGDNIRQGPTPPPEGKDTIT